MSLGTVDIYTDMNCNEGWMLRHAAIDVGFRVNLFNKDYYPQVAQQYLNGTRSAVFLNQNYIGGMEDAIMHLNKHRKRAPRK